MAGIGFALRRLTRRDDLLGAVQGYAYSAMIAAGPWLLTIFAIAAVSMLATPAIGLANVATFRVILIYNFGFSLVIAGPIVLAGTRFLADAIFDRSVDTAPGMLFTSLTLIGGLSAPFVVVFYGFVADLTMEVRLAAMINYFVIAGIWVVAIFLSALKDYATFVGIFLLGTLAAAVGGAVLAVYLGTAGLLLGFTAGLGLIMFTMIARILAEYPYMPVRPFAVFAHARRYWELPVSGFVYNLGIWADKWVMWLAPQHEIIAGAMVTYPDYDGAMFLAYLTIVPAMALFTVSTETRFFEAYQTFYRAIGRHANWREIRENHRAITHAINDSARNLLLLQGAISFVAILLAPDIVSALAGNYVQVGIYRLGVLGAFFHVMFLFATILISYFDLRRLMLELQIVFLVSNIVLTVASLLAGFPWYGYGYFAATLLSFTLSVLVLGRVAQRLPYLAFVRHNPGIARFLIGRDP
ncbi:MAG: exopolysaccharide Pel transporter PelG [Alphaproteobacteria bacterium]